MFRRKPKVGKIQEWYPLTRDSDETGESIKFDLFYILSDYQRLVSEFYTQAASFLEFAPDFKHVPECKIRQRTLLYNNNDIRNMSNYLELMDDYLEQARKIVPPNSGRLRVNINISVRRDTLIKFFLLGEAILKDMHYQSHHLEEFVRLGLYNLMEDIQTELADVEQENELISDAIVDGYKTGVEFVTRGYEKLVNITTKEFPNVLKKLSSYLGLCLTTIVPPVSNVPLNIKHLCQLDKEIHARSDRQKLSQAIMKQYD